MPRVNRREICADDEIQVFHLINRCVRRTFLCGIDQNTGRDFSHRKDWIRDRLEVLAGIFAIDVMGFAVLSNHMHIVARTWPDLVKTWSDEEVAVRWWNLFQLRRQQDCLPAEPTEFELNHIRNDASGLKEKRKRLSNVSWFMKCLSEPIAKRGNREEDVIHVIASMNLDSQAIVRLARNNDGNAVDVRFKYKLVKHWCGGFFV